MASNAAVPFWRAAGMTYITYSNICANLVRNCLKEPLKTEVLSREKVHFSISKWADGKPQKPISMRVELDGDVCNFKVNTASLKFEISDRSSSFEKKV
ncbi:ATP synthase subunit epsilon, mitochondrial, partial [Cucurbita argyrosperma subsp. argyrosperma]